MESCGIIFLNVYNVPMTRKASSFRKCGYLYYPTGALLTCSLRFAARTLLRSATNGVRDDVDEMQSCYPCVCGRRNQTNALCICSSFPEQSDHIINALSSSATIDVDEKIPLLLDGPSGDASKIPNVHIKRHGSLVSVISDEVSFVQRSLENSYSSYGINSGYDDRGKTHCHTKKPDRSGTKAAQRKLTIASIVCLLFLIGEFIGNAPFFYLATFICFVCSIPLFSYSAFWLLASIYLHWGIIC